MFPQSPPCSPNHPRVPPITPVFPQSPPLDRQEDTVVVFCATAYCNTSALAQVPVLKSCAQHKCRQVIASPSLRLP
ncbi:hypothetical protein CLOM_g1299 [Closterium sp. NIES-68]|nr:hypothetical protein CLOM_g1299 [Closterium sp. NIES-68]